MKDNIQLSNLGGWVSIHRSLIISPLWLSEKFTRGQAWVDLFTLANHNEGYIRVRGNRIPIERGQVGWSQLSLSIRWRWSRSKVNNFLNELEKDGKIKHQKTNVSTIITITNYDLYQQNNQQKNNQKSSKTRQTNTNNNVNNEENNNNQNNKSFLPPPLQEIKSFFIQMKSNVEEAEKFTNHYESNGWKIGINPMMNWQASAQNWIKRTENFMSNKINKQPSNFISHDSDF